MSTESLTFTIFVLWSFILVACDITIPYLKLSGLFSLSIFRRSPYQGVMLGLGNRVRVRFGLVVTVKLD